MTYLFEISSFTAIRNALCVGGLASLLLLPSAPGLATVGSDSARLETSVQIAQRGRGRYRPPSGSRITRGDHSGGGVRGCGENIAAIAPRTSGIGQTVSTHPTLVWHTDSEMPSPLELHLYRYQPDGTLETVFIRAVGESEKGYMAYRLPTEEPGLRAGETYLWQVVLYCDPNREEVGMWTAADIEVIPALMGGATEPSEDRVMAAETFAVAGAWYDAIAQLYDATTPAAIGFRQDLLLDLADLEADGTAPASEEISAQLRQIADMQ